MSLPAGDWNINANGYLGTLSLGQLNAQGELSGTVYGQNFAGVWDENAKKLTFIRVIDPNRPYSIQVYTGCLFNHPQPNHRKEFLAGTFEALPGGGGGRTERTLYGWFATQDVVD